jgi:hypothetical protein
MDEDLDGEIVAAPFLARSAGGVSRTKIPHNNAVPAALPAWHIHDLRTLKAANWRICTVNIVVCECKQVSLSIYHKQERVGVRLLCIRVVFGIDGDADGALARAVERPHVPQRLLAGLGIEDTYIRHPVATLNLFG